LLPQSALGVNEFGSTRTGFAGLPIENLKEKRIVTILWQLFLAVDYLHQNKIYHRDLVTKNIMVNPRNLKIRVISFGNCCTAFSGKIMSDLRRDYNYSAPEI